MPIQVSPEDEHLLREFAWRLNNHGYAVRYVYEQGKKRAIALARLIAGAAAGQEVDHINGDPSDNRRENLRLCSHAQNMMNKAMYRNNACGLPNVYYEAARGKRKASFTAQVRVAGSKHRRSGFTTAESAYLAAVKLLDEHHGEFSKAKSRAPAVGAI